MLYSPSSRYGLLGVLYLLYFGFSNALSSPSRKPFSNSSAIDSSVTGFKAEDDTLSSSFVITKSTETLFSAKFSASPNVTGIAKAERCWNEIMTWRNESAAWYNTHVANHTWPVGPTSTYGIDSFISSTTIYPKKVSTYKLCDGTPRADVAPITKHWSGNSTWWQTWTQELTDDYPRTQPCTPDEEMCRLWYYDSNVQKKDDMELLRQCAFPAHIDESCLLGGGPVRLVYFPVTTATVDLCGRNMSTTSTISGGLQDLDRVTAFGRTFTSGSVYLSFKTLYASHDGFWDRVGPTLAILFFPYHLPPSPPNVVAGSTPLVMGRR
ncbi:hypothetical protein LTR37_007950 [Vermiconidia calcicola]|uniref:Uncharacterized protein n=1 Tax=Vermiconidia calcicola TaxID=1690605 RepID=A0ACC3NDN4_9PEZI|nr:hypothetical protein LTR37_007950 [Vermiconidia calcicola]